ncbi:MAG: hypothetical protein RIS79_851 [Verrucomicrobiota bacterium]|jgi:hypothetical protein
MFKEHDDTGDKLEHAYFCYLADKFEREPALLDIPLKNIERWTQRGHWAVKRLDEWKELIVQAKQSQGGLRQLGDVLRADDEETRFFKGFAPFPGVLSEEESEPFLCSSRH